MLKALSGVRIVEQGTFITGPCAAMMLADMGADVIKIEGPGQGDPYRSFRGGIYSPHFQAYNRNKRSLALDLKAPADRETFHRLVAGADVYIQNFRPGAAGRIGADHATLSRLNPRLVYCSISGFGDTGPYVERPSYDSVTQALSGFLSVATDPANPRLLGPAMADAITGLYAALGVLGALVERGRTGRGARLDISMLEAMMHFAIEPFTAYFATGEPPNALDRPRLAQAFLVRCGDGRMIALHLSSVEKFWVNLTDAIGAAGLRGDPRFAERAGRLDNYPQLVEELNRVFAGQGRDAWLETLARFDVPFAPVNAVDEAVADAQAQHLSMVVPVDDPAEGARQAIRPPFAYDGCRAAAVRPAPLLDEHGPAIRAALARAPEQWPAAAVAEPALQP